MLSFPTQTRPLRIVLAEDDEELRARLTLALVRAGHAVVELGDGFGLAEYVALTQVRGGPLPQPDLLLSDLQVSGRHGLEVLSRAHASGLSCPVILLCAVLDEETREAARRLGVRAVLDKPVDLEVLRAKVREATHTPP